MNRECGDETEIKDAQDMLADLKEEKEGSDNYAEVCDERMEEINEMICILNLELNV